MARFFNSNSSAKMIMQLVNMVVFMAALQRAVTDTDAEPAEDGTILLTAFLTWLAMQEKSGVWIELAAVFFNVFRQGMAFTGAVFEGATALHPAANGFLALVNLANWGTMLLTSRNDAAESSPSAAKPS